MEQAKFIHFIRHRLTGGKVVSSDKRRFHSSIIGMAMENAMNTILYEVFRKDPTQLDLYAKQYEAVTASYDAVKRAFVADLPKSVVQLPDNAGIRWVSDKLYPNDHLIQLSRQSAMNFNELHLDRHDDTPSFFLLNQTLVLTGMNRGSVVVTGEIVENSYYIIDGDPITHDSVVYSNGEVMKGTSSSAFTGDGTVYDTTPITDLIVSIVVPFSDLDDTDEFIFPSGKNYDILRMVFDYFDMPLQDLKNDSKSQ